MRPLRIGDRVQLVAASSAIHGPAAAERLLAGCAVLAGWGLQTPDPEWIEKQLLGRHWGYLAGRDAQRLEDLSDETAALLACVRGGWGAARLLEHGPALPDRWLLGFSDVTSLLWAQCAQGRSGAIHGPLVTTLAAEPDWSQERLRQLLFGEPLPPLRGLGLGGGRSIGRLLVGNLTVATHLIGTRLLPPLKGAVLVLEDVGEAPYRIDRMLTHWRLSGALRELAAIGFGRFSDCEDGPEPDAAVEAAAQRRFGLEQVLQERTADLGIPVVMDLPVGHVCGNAALPLGALACLDGDAGSLELLS
ncbi:MAG: LD-carboxypeptidase [Cyanobacteriota bacterium]|nr:LD-carboxypeptidase [Cyanobacteriota bacterium]